MSLSTSRVLPWSGTRAAVVVLALVTAITAAPVYVPGSPKERPTEFTEGTTEPRPRGKGSKESLEIESIARLSFEAWKAFDAGDEATGRKQAREAIRKLEGLEQTARGRSDGRRASRYAAQRGRLQLGLLGDTAAAREAFLDALADDENEPTARRELEGLLMREAGGTEAPAGRGANEAAN